MNKIGALLLTTGLVFTLTACGESDVTVKDKPNGEEPKVEQKKEEKSDSKLGTRSNPVKFNEIATIKTYSFDDASDSFETNIELSVTEVIRGEEAYNKLLEMNEFNEAPPEGYEWAMAKVKVKVVNSETADYPFMIDHIFNFKMISVESGDVYTGDITGTVDPDFTFEMYEGNEKEGYMAKLVKVGEQIQLEYNDYVSSTFINLQ